jgi:hypothetical protein
VNQTHTGRISFDCTRMEKDIQQLRYVLLTFPIEQQETEYLQQKVIEHYQQVSTPLQQEKSQHSSPQQTD